MEDHELSIYKKILKINSVKQLQLKKYNTSKKALKVNESTSMHKEKHENPLNITLQLKKTLNTSLNGSKTSRVVKLQAIAKKKNELIHHQRQLLEELSEFKNQIEYKYYRSKANELYVFPKVISEDQIDDYINEEDESEGILNNYLCTLPSSIYYHKAKKPSTPMTIALRNLCSTNTTINEQNVSATSRIMHDIRKKQTKRPKRNMILCRQLNTYR